MRHHLDANVAAVLCGGCLLSAFLAESAFAHSSIGLQSQGVPWWSVWDLDLPVLCSLVATTVLYVEAVRRIWQRNVGRVVSKQRVISFLVGIGFVFVSLISPLAFLAEQMNSWHMVQHMVLMLVAAPFVVIGVPIRVLRRGFPKTIGKVLQARADSRLAVAYLIWQPFFAWSCYAVALWLWHVPMLYEAALRWPTIHDLQHLTFFCSACLFWRLVLDPVASRYLSFGVGVIYLFAASLQASVLGIYMTFSNRVWYGSYDEIGRRLGIDVLGDQQLSGALMWMPACLVYAGIATYLVTKLLGDDCEEEGFPLVASKLETIKGEKT